MSTRKKLKKFVIGIVVSATLIASSLGIYSLANPAYDEKGSKLNFFENIKEKTIQVTETIKNTVTNTVESVKTGVETAKDYAEAVGYVAEHKDAVMESYEKFETGEITKQEMVEEIIEEVDVEYVYNFLEKHGTEEVKQQISTMLKDLENSGINIYDYVDEEMYNKIAESYLNDLPEGTGTYDEQTLKDLADSFFKNKNKDEMTR